MINAALMFTITITRKHQHLTQFANARKLEYTENTSQQKARVTRTASTEPKTLEVHVKHMNTHRYKFETMHKGQDLMVAFMSLTW